MAGTLSCAEAPVRAIVAGSIAISTNIGLFNAGETAATVTFRLYRPDGTVVDPPAVREIPPGSQQQVPLNQLFPGIEAMDALYVTFTSAGVPVYVYASVVDNKNGDAIFIPAQPR